MRIVILTSFLYGGVTLILPRLVAEPEIEIAMIIYDRGRILHPLRFLRQKMKKVI